MKPLFTLLFAALAFAATAQPQKIHYQGVAVGANGKPIKNSTVGLRLSVLDSLPTGTALYTETQTASTDASGQFSIYLGGGTATAGTFANLPWANGNDKFLKVEMDAQGGTNYQPMGTTQLVSVPYAMSAKSAINLVDQYGKEYRIIEDKGVVGLTPISKLTMPNSYNPNCSGAITYQNQIYNLIQIGNQCWMKENLNIGNMIGGLQDQLNNQIVEKYCYNNDYYTCGTFGGLYQWAEAMNYQYGASNDSLWNPGPSGPIQGICPNGWHIPSQMEFCTLLQFIDGNAGCGFNVGNVAGKKLRSTQFWSYGPGIFSNDTFGFGFLPTGNRNQYGGFSGFGTDGHILTSTDLGLDYSYFYSNRNDNSVLPSYMPKKAATAVRCLKNPCYNVTQANANAIIYEQVSKNTIDLVNPSLQPGEFSNWRVISGLNGTLFGLNSGNPYLLGQPGETYRLEFSISNGCFTSKDSIEVKFRPFLIGQNYQDGIIVSVDSTYQHGLIAYPRSIGNAKFGDTLINVPNTLLSIGSGWQNTLRILQSNLNDTTSAAWICDQFVSQNGYSDWFLPSFDELNLAINPVMGGAGTDAWSSSQDLDFKRAFGGGAYWWNGGPQIKTNKKSIIPFRKF
jgi:uncharacterized protein (TIGR02145 family)